MHETLNPADRFTLRDTRQKLTTPSAKQQVVDRFVHECRISDTLMSTPGDERAPGEPELHGLH